MRADEKFRDTSSEPLGQVAYHRIRDGIKSGVLKPGQHIREITIADWLEMSRTPVREAFRRLEADGLVTIGRRRGYMVTQLDHQAVIELFTTREALEGTAAGLAARHASDPEVALLEQMIGQERAIGQDSAALRDHNEAFHRELFSCAHNRYLLQAAGILSTSMILLKNTSFGIKGRPDTALAEHSAVVAAIASRDPDAANAAARAHIQTSLQYRLQLMSQDRQA